MSINQNHFGVGNNIVNVGLQGRHLEKEEQKNQLKQIDKNKKINITFPMGDPEALNYAHEVSTFLKSEGYDVQGFIHAIYDNPFVGQFIKENINDNSIDLFIGSKQN